MSDYYFLAVYFIIMLVSSNIAVPSNISCAMRGGVGLNFLAIESGYFQNNFPTIPTLWHTKKIIMLTME